MAIRHVTPIPRKLAVGRVAEVYAQSVAEFGQAALMMLSPAPDLHAAAWALLREAELAGHAPRVDKEVVAVAVSQANRCRFCIDAHTILVHALGEHQLAEDLLADKVPAEPEQAALAAWAKGTRAPSTAQLPPPPFHAALSAEYLGTVLSTHFTNRMFSALTDEQLLPGNLQRSRSVRRVGAMAYTRIVHRDLAPGQSLPLLDGLRATVAEWDGAHLSPHGVWLTQALAGLPESDRPATRLALLAALAPHHVSDADVAAWRATGRTTDGDLVRLLAFGAITAVDRIADTLASATATR